MSKSTKYILYGVGNFALVIVILAVVRSLVKGVAIEEGFKNPTNWLLAAVGGVAAAWSAFSKATAKEAREKKEKEASGRE